MVGEKSNRRHASGRFRKNTFSALSVSLLLSLLAAALAISVSSASTFPFLSSLANAQFSTCRTGTINLATLEPTSYVVGNMAYTFGFCDAVQPTAAGLHQCLTAGYVSYHAITNGGACTHSLNVIRTGLAKIGPNVSTYSVSDVSGENVAVVRMICDWSSTSATTATLLTPITTSTRPSSPGSSTIVTTTEFSLTSRAACPAGTVFCDPSQGIMCSGSLTCINEVCVDTSCTTITPAYPVAISRPADFISLMKVADCHGTPVSNLTRDYFTITMAGRPVDDAVYLGEASLLFEPTSPSASLVGAVPLLTTLLLDQSNSVVGYYEDRLIEAAKNMTRRIMAANPNNYVAVAIFDGSVNTYVIQTHTTNETAVIEALDALPLPTRDRQSTNLYGAIINTMREAYRVKFSFPHVNASDIFSSVVLFTDGFDTSGRDERSEAIAQAERLGYDVTMMSVGIANTSDIPLLTAISNGYAVFADGIGDLADAFDDIADRIVSVSRNYYNILFCMPMRGPNVPVVIGLNTTVFPDARPLEYYVDASQFTSGCNATHLRTQMLRPPNVTADGSSPFSPRLNASGAGPLSSLLAPQSAFYFEWSFGYDVLQQIITVTPAPTNVFWQMIAFEEAPPMTTTTTVTSTTATVGPTTTSTAPLPTTTADPNATDDSSTTTMTTTTATAATATATTTVAVVPTSAPVPTAVPPLQPFNLTSNPPRCELSPYCYDGVFTSTFMPITGASYRAFAVYNIPSVPQGAAPLMWDAATGEWVAVEVWAAGGGTLGQWRGFDALADDAATPLRVTVNAVNWIAPKPTTSSTAPLPTTPTTFPTFRPQSTTTRLTTAPMTVPPRTIPAEGFFTVYTDPNDLSLSSDLDLPATVILAVYFIIFSLLMLIFVFYRVCTDQSNMSGMGRMALPPSERGGEPLAVMMKERHEPLVLRSDSPPMARPYPYTAYASAGAAESIAGSSRSPPRSGSYVPPPAAAAGGGGGVIGASALFAQGNPYDEARRHQHHNATLLSAANYNDRGFSPPPPGGSRSGSAGAHNGGPNGSYRQNEQNPIDSYFPVVPPHHQQQQQQREQLYRSPSAAAAAAAGGGAGGSYSPHHTFSSDAAALGHHSYAPSYHSPPPPASHNRYAAGAGDYRSDVRMGQRADHPDFGPNPRGGSAGSSWEAGGGHGGGNGGGLRRAPSFVDAMAARNKGISAVSADGTNGSGRYVPYSPATAGGGSIDNYSFGLGPR